MHDVVIVGNGPSLLDLKIGPLIDSHQTVVRISNFSVAKKLQAYTGTKTNVWFGYFAPHPLIPTFDLVVSCYANQHEIARQRSEAIHKCCEEANVNCEIPPKSVERCAHEALRLECTGTSPFPTTGFVAITYYLMRGVAVDICGFDLYSRGCYYWDKSALVRGSVWRDHDILREREVLQSYADSGQVTFL